MGGAIAAPFSFGDDREQSFLDLIVDVIHVIAAHIVVIEQRGGGQVGAVSGECAR